MQGKKKTSIGLHLHTLVIFKILANTFADVRSSFSSPLQMCKSADTVRHVSILPNTKSLSVT